MWYQVLHILFGIWCCFHPILDTHTHLKFLSLDLLSIHKNKDLCEHILVLNVWQEFNYSVTISQLVMILWIKKSQEESTEVVSKSRFVWMLYYTYFQDCTLTNCIGYLFQWNTKNLWQNGLRDQEYCPWSHSWEPKVTKESMFRWPVTWLPLFCLATM